MAKYGVTNVAGGGGIGSDELSVTKDYVLNGKTYVGTDTNDEMGTGTMANNGTTANQSLNAGGSFQVKKGYHAQNFLINANSLASQTSATATSGHILNGHSAWVNGAKVNGSIPWQNADVSGTDRVRATNMSNWAGTINLGVRNGHYLNGVNWIQQDIPNFQPGNIKKGVNIGGVVGTWEGYVPQPSDLYSYGNNVGNFQAYTGSTPGAEGIRFESGMISLSGIFNSKQRIVKQLDLTGINWINVRCGWPNGDGRLLIETHNPIGSLSGARIDKTSIGAETTVSLNVAAIQAVKYISIGPVNRYIYIYHIWTS